MALEPIDKMRIGKYLKTNGLDDLCWGGFFEGVKKNKYNDYDVLVFLVDSVVKKLTSREDISEKLLLKYIVYVDRFYWWASEKELPAVNVVAKIRVFKEKYLEYVAQKGIEASDEIVKYIENMLAEIDKEHGKEEASSEEVSKYVQSIMEMEAKIEQLTKDLAEARRQISVHEKSKSDTQKKNNKNETELTELRSKVKEYKTQIAELTQQVEELKQRATCTQEEYDALVTKYNSLQTKIETLTGDYKELKKTSDSQARKIAKYEKKEEERAESAAQHKSRLAFEKELDDKIISLLFGGQYTVSQIVDKLNKDGSSYSLIEVSESLTRVKLKLSIMNGKNISYPQVYGVCPPSIKTHTNLNLSVDTDVLDIMIISDLHLTEISNRVIKRLNTVYEYCAEKGIKYIMNLGDLFDLSHNSVYSYETYSQHQKLIDAIVRNFPHDDNIVHFVLGGNHDRSATAFGIDSIEEITKRRTDFINLGYSHSSIGIEGNTNNELIGLHHPKGWVVESVDDFDLGAGQITRYLEQSCSGLEKNYIDLFGHLHASRIDTVNGYGTVPSLFYDKERSGAWHVKIYLDKNKNIKYMVFIQLLAEKRLDKVSEVGYQRIIK